MLPVQERGRLHHCFGRSLLDILFGVCCPSGKLAETFAKVVGHTPPFPFYSSKMDAVYRKVILGGYRYDTRGIEPLFPFGYGLRCTGFQFSNLVVEVKHEAAHNISVSVALKVKDTRKGTGKEVMGPAKGK
ncbi:glycoside hydrolase family protein [Trypanosoma rangeli]|uniref:beta-glucosidase n=1 Tax=Trypanosoma rangeli TaxID=5698 RepID=A0A3R7KPS2_TRYRA|nr:glycoside hydrolase family protein [Trypanosoma rangeli]RNE98971.1 glycoside hydrolase family protein [Trypanosoma rangeli]|eukprot:RNE98971.1 glycoside hydrolase family protein [Trypanosoma rangeli]